MCWSISASSSCCGDLPLLLTGVLERLLGSGSGKRPGGGSIGGIGVSGVCLEALEVDFEFLRIDFLTLERVSPPSLVDVESDGGFTAGGTTLGCCSGVGGTGDSCAGYGVMRIGTLGSAYMVGWCGSGPADAGIPTKGFLTMLSCPDGFRSATCPASE